MYLVIYGLQFDPFSKREQAKVAPYFSADFREGYGRLDFLKDSGGIGVLTSAPGMGKTYCMKVFADGLDPKQYCMRYISLSALSDSEFYRLINISVGGHGVGRKAKLFREFHDNVWEMYRERNITMILAIDDAQYLSPTILRELKALLNYQYDSVSCLALVLCGDKQLDWTLSLADYEALRQRISVHYQFSGLALDELEKYVAAKLAAAGGTGDILDEEAISALYNVTKGVPRIVDNVMSYALKLGSQQNRPHLDADIIEESGEAQFAKMQDD